MTDFLTVLGLIATVVLGVAAILVSIFIYRRQNPRREFTYSASASPLVNAEIRGLNKLVVAYDGSPLTHPYLLNLQVASTGRADISSSSFDGGKPILFELNVPVLGEIDQIGSTDTVSARLKFAERQSAIELPPTLLPKGFSIRASYLCDGKPVVEPKIELTDIPVRTSRLLDTAEHPKSSSFKFATAVALVSMAAFIAQLQGPLSELFARWFSQP